MFGSNEDISVMKINTHAGQDAFVYIMQKNPSLFEFNKIIFPTGSPSISFYIGISVANIGRTFPEADPEGLWEASFQTFLKYHLE